MKTVGRKEHPLQQGEYRHMARSSTTMKKGETRNPNGRPKKGYSITEWFKEMLASTPEVKDAIGKSIMKKALEGDTAAQKMVWQYMDGMPKQSIELSGDEDNPIRVEVSDTLKKIYGSGNDKSTGELPENSA